MQLDGLCFVLLESLKIQKDSLQDLAFCHIWLGFFWFSFFNFCLWNKQVYILQIQGCSSYVYFMKVEICQIWPPYVKLEFYLKFLILAHVLLH